MKTGMNRIIFSCLVFVLAINNIGAQTVQEGLKAPDFSLYNLEGEKSTLDDYKGKVVVIKMWFKECAPCLQEIPKVNRLVEKYKNRTDIVFIAPAPNDKRTLKKFARKVDFNYEIMYSSYEMLREYNTMRRYPSHCIIDKYGVVSFLYEGSSQTIDKTIEAEILKVLN